MRKRVSARALLPQGHRLPPPVVLHIDDDPNDAALLQAAARHANLDFALHTVGDGEQAIAYLTGQNIYADRDRYHLPMLVLLDLKMPRATGFEVLRWIRAHPVLRRLPVVVLSGSELQEDMHRAYLAGANSYLVKPLGFQELVGLVQGINNAWLVERAPLRPPPNASC